MYFYYCKGCKTKECTYKSTRKLMALFEEKNYKFAGCPDKEPPNTVQKLLLKLNPTRAPYILENGSHCTADIRMMDDNNNELYLEIKQIPFTFESSKEIGSSKAQERIVFLIYHTLSMYNEYAEIIRENYTIKVESGYIPDFDFSTFYDQFCDEPETLNEEVLNFIDELGTYIENNVNNWQHFSYRRKNCIEISFIPSLPFSAESYKSGTNSNAASVTESNSPLRSVTLLSFILDYNGFNFEISPNKTGSINLGKYVELLLNTNDLITQLLKNFDKAKNSFYGINNRRYVIQEIFFKQNNDTFYFNEENNLNPIGFTLLNNIAIAIDANINSINSYTKYFDKSYLFLPIGEVTYYFELF